MITFAKFLGLNVLITKEISEHEFSFNVGTNLNCIWLYIAQSLKFTSVVDRLTFEMLETVAMFLSRPISKHE